MPTNPILTDAQAFQFETLAGQTLELFGALINWSDEIPTGIVEHQVVKRQGAIHQRVGAPPRSFDFRCVFRGPGRADDNGPALSIRARYVRVVDAVLEQPEGKLTHPRFGTVDAVCKSVSGSESPGDATDEIQFTLKFSETGLTDPPQPAPGSLAQGSAARASTAATLSASSSAAVAAAGAQVSARALGFQSAMADAETGLGTLLDVDASLAELQRSVDELDALGAPKTARSAAAQSFALALQARNAFLVGRPPLILRRVEASTSLGAFCQSLYGSRALEAKAEILRLNRVARPYSVPAGTVLLLSDPSVVVQTS